MRRKVFAHYGTECECCGEPNEKLLSIDHINDDGAEHRRRIRTRIASWLVKNNYPPGFRILCFGCNAGRYLNGGICPHEEEFQKEYALARKESA